MREVARFVFRKHPEIVRKAASAYERTRRVAYKRKATIKKNETTNQEENKQPTPVAPNA